MSNNVLWLLSNRLLSLTVTPPASHICQWGHWNPEHAVGPALRSQPYLQRPTGSEGVHRAPGWPFEWRAGGAAAMPEAWLCMLIKCHFHKKNVIWNKALGPGNERPSHIYWQGAEMPFGAGLPLVSPDLLPPKNKTEFHNNCLQSFMPSCWVYLENPSLASEMFTLSK